jgi:carbonic anhydrase
MLRRFLLATALVTALIAPVVGSESAHHWSYWGKSGPTHWAELDHGFARCAAGKSQSPININTHKAHAEALPRLVFDYRPTTLHIIDNGHTVQVNAEPGSSLRIGNDTFELVQFHFHHPSEERIDRKGFDMVAHLVHRDRQGRLAVVAVLLESGSESPLVETLWRNHPRQIGHEEVVRGVSIDPTALLPKDRGYFSYIGSLTTPPCSEGVRWFVLKSPTTVSKSEIATFAAEYPNDARPLQPLNGRQILSAR